MLETLTHTEWCAFIGSIVNKYISVCHQDVLIEMDDLEQEAWSALLTAAKNYNKDKAKGKFTSYAWIYIHHNVRNFVYSRVERNSAFVNYSEISEDGVPDVEDPYNDFGVVDNDADFKLAVSSLKDEEMELIDQKFVKSMTYREMAEIAGVRPQAMQVRVSKIIEKLQKRLSIENHIIN